MLPEHVKLLRELAVNLEKVEKPILDEQTYEQFDQLIYEAMAENYLVHFFYYQNGKIKSFKGKVHSVDLLQRELKMIDMYANKQSLQFDYIVGMNKFDEN